MTTPETFRLFLDDAQLHQLTGRQLKALQIQWLRAEGIAFRVNATGHPVVTRAAVEGRKPEPVAEAPQRWQPRVVGA